MTIENGYATLDEIKASKGITSVDLADDGFIEELVEAASRYIDTFTGRRFYTTTADETRTFQAEYRDLVMTGDLLSVTTLKTDLDGDRTYETTWAAGDYDLRPDNAALDKRPYTCIACAPNGAHAFPAPARGVQIVGKFGYCTLANRPADIHLACMEIVTSVYQNRFGANTSGAATITGAGVVITPQDIPASAAAILRGYRELY
jgi:hypothetical protein